MTPDKGKEKQEPQQLFQEGEKARFSFFQGEVVEDKLYIPEIVFPYTLYSEIRNHY